MASARSVVLCSLLAAGASVEVTPFEKVVKLIKDLKSEVESEGSEEAKGYEKFACFCKKTTTKKSNSIKKTDLAITDLSADIAKKTGQKKDDTEELAKRKRDQEQLSKDLDDTTARCAQEKAAYQAEEADQAKAISSLKKAIKSMKDSNSAASLIAIKSVVSSLEATKTSSLLAQNLKQMVKQRVDPSDPGYDFHSGDIIEMCEALLQDFEDSKKQLDSDWSKTSKGCDETKRSLRSEMGTNSDAMDALDQEINKLGTEIAKDRQDLIDADALMKDEELYLKDLTAQCETRANDYDQRSQMRGQELQALTQALEVLTKEVAKADEDVNQRAFLQEGSKQLKSVALQATAGRAAVKGNNLSFLQGFLSKTNAKSALDLENKKNRALTMLQQEGRRLGSMAIQSLALRASADPFTKVKGLIQKLIERLLAESAAEATKKGFCDTELAKAEHDRDSRYADANKLSSQLASLEAKQDQLNEEIDVLTRDIKDESKALKEATVDREEEKKDNLKALQTAKDGLAGVTEALQILKSFYSQAAKASFIQASPLDEDTKGAGFSGSYSGKQGGMKAVFSLLEVIKSDFDRTIRTTEKSEEQAHREFVEFKQTSDASIAGKSTKKQLDKEDLKTTKASLAEKTSDLQSNMNLLDDALKELEELKPTCIDTGMSYAERVEKREEEMRALKKALCMLDGEGVEPDCK